MLAHYITLRPLVRAYKTWYPDANPLTNPPPDDFSRHATAHGLGYPDVTNKHHALVAIMLATSLTRQFSHDLTQIA